MKQKGHSYRQAGFAPIIILLTILILGGIVAGMVYFKGKTNQFTAVYPQPTSSQSQLSIIPTISQSDQTANWKTYVDKQYGFSFRYPNEAEFRDYKETPKRVGIVMIGPTQKASGRTQSDLFDGYIFSVGIYSKISEGSSITIADKTYNSDKQVCTPDATFSNIKDIDIAGKIARTYSVQNCLGDYTATFIGNSEYVFGLTQIYNGDRNNQVNYKQITDQILSTFHFTQ